MAAITKVTPSISGAVFTPAAASGGGDSFANSGKSALLYVNNGGGAPITVTITAQQTARAAEGAFPAMTLADLEVTVNNGQTKFIGPLPEAYNDSSGDVQVTYSGVTSVTVGVIQP